ncbi:uncharacterized protein LOC143049603 [Mytilus galloprovincialis]|uniref:uncharacterized protein LOC143049603 n=1 Tax=Mytilus galloprovincialis TaxID=29158 RepID=UPI003F7C7BA7
MENTSFHILRICIYVYITELQHVQLSSVPNPCPDFTPSATIADMCTNDFAKEEPSNGGTTTDSVALRVMTKQDGCTCEVSLQNQYMIYTLYMRRYDLQTRAAPEGEACGLVIDIDYTIPDTYQANKDSIECMQGTNVRSVSLLQNGVLKLSSRIIGGNFSRGYCIQIYRQHTAVDNVGIHINCSLSNSQTTQQDKTVSSNMQTTQPMFDATIQDDTVISNIQTTQHMTDAAIEDYTFAGDMQTTGQMADAVIEDNAVSDIDSTLYIAIGVGSAVVVVAFCVVVAIIIIRRKGNKNNDGIEVQSDINSNDDDSDGLKYNCLYNTSEQNIMEGNHHTVDIENKQNPGIQIFDSDYSTVDGNYSSVEIVNMHLHEGSDNDRNIKSTSTTSPRSEIKRTEEEPGNNLKDVTAGSNAEYAIVNKTTRTGQNIKHVTAPFESTVEYAVVDKNKKIKSIDN